MNQEELIKLVESNARAIQAISNERKEFERQLNQDRNRLYQSMSNLANAQATMATTHAEFQSNFYARQAELDKRQSEIVEILKVLTKKIDEKSEE